MQRLRCAVIGCITSGAFPRQKIIAKIAGDMVINIFPLILEIPVIDFLIFACCPRI